MNVIGEGQVYFYDGVDECPHAPFGGETWQESFVVYFFDPTQNVYAFVRLSQVPNKQETTAWINIWTPEHFYKRTENALPLDQSERTATAISVGNGLCRYEYRDGNHLWHVQDEDIRLDLCIEDYHQGLGYWPKSNDAAKEHIEATGWATGSVTVKGKTYNTAGTCWRDHSWGERDWNSLGAHRFFPALFDRNLNFFFFSTISAEGVHGKFAVIIKDGTVQFTQDFTVTAYMAEDGVSNRGGRVELNWDQETYLMEFEPRTKGAISLIESFPCSDTMCIVRMGDRVGVGVAETSNNTQHGKRVPFIFDGQIENGIYSRG